MLDVVIDTLLDVVKLIPFLFISFLIIELIEHKLSNKSKKAISKSGKYGPIIGGLLGIFPQCGFSVTATNLYITRIISLGTLIAIYLSTSDEMLPILISEQIPIMTIIKILSIKLIVGITVGFIIDFILRKQKRKKDYGICDEEHCHCEKGIFLSSLIHTAKTLLFIALVSFAINILIYYLGEEYLSKIMLQKSILGPVVTGLFGLIPNCASSVMITQLYINDAISFGSMMAGLLAGSGVALLVLFKSNKNIKENLTILGIIYTIGVLSGIIIDLFKI